MVWRASELSCVGKTWVYGRGVREDGGLFPAERYQSDYSDDSNDCDEGNDSDGHYEKERKV